MEKKVTPFLSLLLFIVLSNSLSYAQSVQPTQWKLLFSKSNPAVNDTLTLTFIGIIPSGQGVYSTEFKCDYGPKEAYIEFNKLNNDFQLVDSSISVGDSIAFDEIFECTLRKFKNVAVIKQVIQIKKKNPNFSGTLYYQTCNEDQCLKYNFAFKTKGTTIIKMKNGR